MNICILFFILNYYLHGKLNILISFNIYFLLISGATGFNVPIIVNALDAARNTVKSSSSGAGHRIVLRYGAVEKSFPVKISLKLNENGDDWTVEGTSGSYKKSNASLKSSLLAFKLFSR